MKVGDKIKVQSRLRRCQGYRPYGKNKPYNRRYKSWQIVEMLPCEVLFLGYRTLGNGWTDWESECGYIYEHDEHVKAALVIWLDGRSNPFYVQAEEACYES